jgi:hypothetical protein
MFPARTRVHTIHGSRRTGDRDILRNGDTSPDLLSTVITPKILQDGRWCLHPPRGPRDFEGGMHSSHRMFCALY